jgi:alpha-galactosidase
MSTPDNSLRIQKYLPKKMTSFSWPELIRNKLNLPWDIGASHGVPFGLAGPVIAAEGQRGIPQATHWENGKLETTGDSALYSAETAGGLRGEFRMRFFPDTHAMECWGEIANRGSETVRDISEARTLDLKLGTFDRGLGQPWIRTVHGVGHQPPGSFDPYDFSPEERQLLHMDSSFGPISIDPGPNGWSSEYFLPCAFVLNERKTGGLALFLEWSGMWNITFHLLSPSSSNSGGLHLRAGISSLHIHLEPGQSLPLPRLLLTAFDGDFSAGSNALRRHIRRHVTPRLEGKEMIPPVTFNHFFGLGGNRVSSSLLRPVIDLCGELGVEYFSVDGGWAQGGFRRGIGNWEEDRAKFPEGLSELAKYIRSKGMGYGSWFELEWAFQASPLHREHPDWFLPTPATHPLWRNPTQHYVHPDCHLLDLGNREARQWCLDRLMRAHEEWGMRWLRYDFNQIPRPNWEEGVPVGQIGWRQIGHVHGFYRLLDDLMAACPALVIEQSASGAHRLDLGAMRRGHTLWMNDHTHQTDIVRGLQQGLNAVLPGNYPNTNICQHRLDYDDYDFLSHGAGPLGLSLPLHQATRTQLERFRAGLDRFKSYRSLLMGDFHEPQGRPRSADAPTTLVFTDGGKSASLRFNQTAHRQAELVLK